MQTLPLSDQFTYRFEPPRHNRLLISLGRWYVDSMLRRRHAVEEVDIAGLERIAPLLQSGDGVLLAPNHCDHADCYVMFHLSKQMHTAFYYMAAFQIFGGKNRWILPRLGAFPVDREGADVRAFKTGVEILGRGREPLVIFPEGEIYRLTDRLTPLREGAVAVAATAAKKGIERNKTVWIVPIALKYRYLESCDPEPAALALMDRLEDRLTWRPRQSLALLERLYAFADAALALKEYEHLGSPRSGPLSKRIAALRDSILDAVEDRRVGKRSIETTPLRVKNARRACLDLLADPQLTPASIAEIRRDLDDLHLAVQLFSYPGDYVRERPTVERLSETLMKFEEDFLGVIEATPHGPRRAVVRVGEPINVGTRLTRGARPRAAVATLTHDLEISMQSLLDSIPPGRFLPGPPPTFVDLPGLGVEARPAPQSSAQSSSA